jgi:DNA-binding transcriptional LysR family regulator
MVTIVLSYDPMDVRDLQIFLSVAKHLNYTRAAEEVNLSQPSVSVRVRELERDLGTKLFEQLGKRISLTEAGQVLLPYAIKVIAATDDGVGVWGSNPHAPTISINNLALPTSFSVTPIYAIRVKKWDDLRYELQSFIYSRYK